LGSLLGNCGGNREEGSCADGGCAGEGGGHELLYITGVRAGRRRDDADKVRD
jgi:hypothetical protein